MKFIKKKFLVFILLIFFMTLLSLTAVSAADYTVSGNDFGNIQSTVDGVGSGDVINLAGGTYNGSGSEISVSTNNLVFNGQGAILDANGNSRIFMISSDNVTLQNMILRNGNFDGYGAAVYVAGANFKIINCSVLNNFGDGGGGIMITSSSPGSIVDNCMFSSNVASYGAKNGGALAIHASNVRVSNSVFINNTADGHGGALTVNTVSGGTLSNINISNCNFTSNTATTMAGGIFLSSNITVFLITGCLLSDNTAPMGGGIYTTSPLSISSSTFKNNSANNGGGIYSTNRLTLSSTSGTNNKATSDNGGFIYGTGTININGGTFSSNIANSNGGAIYTTGSSRSNIINSKFTSNSAKNGGAIYNNAPLTVSSSTFKSNKARSNGGALYANKNLNISGGSITSNNASYGSGIYNLATLRVYKVYMSSNFAKVISITLKTPTEVKPSKKFTINVYLKTGDNIAGFIYNKNGNTYINGSRKLPLVYTPFKTFFSSIGASKNNIKSSSNGVATRTDTAGKSKFTVKVSYSQGGKTWSINKTVKVTSSAKNTKKTYTTKKSTNNKPVSKNNQSTTNVKSGTSIKVSLSNHEHAHLASLVNMDSYTINSKKISYWNLKKSTTLTRVTDYIYKVDKNGWYSGTINSKNGVSWKKLTKKPNKSGNWFNLTNTSGKYVIRNKVTQYTNDTSKNALMFFVSVKTSINHNSLIPYISYNYTLVNKNTKSKKTVRFFEEATTDIYFLKSTSYNSKLKNYLKHKDNRVQVGNNEIKKLIIDIFQKRAGNTKSKKLYGKYIEGELTSLNKIKAIFYYLRDNVDYQYYTNGHFKSLDVFWRMNKWSNDHANCVDQSVLLVTMLRTVGVPANFENWHGCKFKYNTYGHVFVYAYSSNSKKYLLDTTGSSNTPGTHPNWSGGSGNSYYSIGNPKGLNLYQYSCKKTNHYHHKD